MARAAAGRPDRGVVVYGLRGVGKTVLLGQMASEAEERGWIVAQVEAGGDDFRKQLGDRLYPALHREVKPGIGQRMKRALATFSVFNVQVDSTGTWTFGIDLDPVPPPSGRLEVDLLTLFRDLAEAAAEDGRGVAVFVDEMQELDSETLAALCAAAHQASQRRQPFFICGAGLPSLPRLLSEAKSYAERLFIYERIGPLADAEAIAALRDPASDEGVRWDQDALARVVDATGRYPYFLQEFGDACWSNAEGPKEITAADARVGIVDGQRRLDVGFFLARWERATKTERTYLSAMADLMHEAATNGATPAGEPEVGVATKDVADRMGRKINSLGPTRASLIAKGLIYAPEHGVIAYTVPRMGDFIRRQPKA